MNTTTASGYDAQSVQEGAGLLKAIAHPLRLAILAALLDGHRCVHEIVEATGATQPLVSQHLRVLRAADLLSNERRGREVVYSITDDHIHHIVLDTLEHVRLEGSDHGAHVHEA
ncbi:MAG: metalloregulator ArsR/SmtB family transcription factor [Actinomycetota bacterium]